MDDNIFNPRKRLLTEKETVELVEVIEAANAKISGGKVDEDDELSSINE